MYNKDNKTSEQYIFNKTIALYKKVFFQSCGDKEEAESNHPSQNTPDQ